MSSVEDRDVHPVAHAELDRALYEIQRLHEVVTALSDALAAKSLEVIILTARIVDDTVK